MNKQERKPENDGQREFENVLKNHKIREKLDRLRISWHKTQDIDVHFRKQLIIEYYRVPEEYVDALIITPPENRRKICKQTGINPYVFRTLFDYSAYPHCLQIYDFLESLVDFSKMNVLDFGCLVSDFGFFFGQLGARITVCDFKEPVDFASYRLKKANIAHTVVYAPADYQEVTRNQDFVIFSEVLEHLDDPFSLLKACVDNHVNFLYTTCYPYGNDTYFGLRGHSREAQKQSPESINLLREHYQEISFQHYQRLWILKEIIE